MGVGKAGSYRGHSHLFFHDIIYCPSGLVCSSPRLSSGKATLVIVPRETYLGEVNTDDFFFIKFSASPADVSFPEKIYECLNATSIILPSPGASLRYVYYKSRNDVGSELIIHLHESVLNLRIANAEYCITI